MTLHHSALVLAGLLGAAATASAQAGDAGVLLIRAGGREIGSESFRVAGTATGLRITSHAIFPGPRPQIEYTGTFDGSASGDLGFQLEYRGPMAGQIYAVQRRNRITVRRVEKGAEQASELPGSPVTVLLADSLLAPYLQILPLVGDSSRNLMAVFPVGARRTPMIARRVPAESGHGSLIRLSGAVEGEIQLGDRGELLRITLPGLGLEGVRKRE